MTDMTSADIALVQSLQVYDRIAAVKVKDLATYFLIGDLLKEVRHVVDKFESENRPEIKKAYELHKDLLAKHKRWSEKFAEAEELAKEKLKRFYDEQSDVDLPKIEGIAVTETWTGEVTDADAIPRQYMVPDTAKLLGLTKALKEATQIPGWQTKKVRSVSVRV